MHFGGPVLFDGVSVDIAGGAKVGLVGRNGSGKSTLLHLLAGTLEPTAGRVTRSGALRIGVQTQEMTLDSATTVFAALREVFAEDEALDAQLRALEADIAAATDPDRRARLLRSHETLQARQLESGVFDVDRRVGTTLNQLGFREGLWSRTVGTLSGGERNILGLARVLVAEPDLALLDEPTNHLDLDGVAWFVSWLRRTRSAVLMVSHDRHVLNEGVREIWDLEQGQIVRYAGNYTAFREQRAKVRAQQLRQYKAQQREIERIEFQARRLMDMANAYDDPAQAKRAKAMRNRLERMDRVEKPVEDTAAFRAAFDGVPRHGRIALTLDDVTLQRGSRTLLDRAHLAIEYGERVALVGSNGSGKTSLFRLILDEGAWENPSVRLGKSVAVGEYRQLHDKLDPATTLLDWMQEATGLDIPGAAALLHRFLFSREDLERSIATLSGGEKSRLQIARLVHDRVNFLFLDEPTNHLDLESCEQLESMLQGFEGTLFVISHDRTFLAKLVTRVVEIRDQALVDHACGFEAWWTARAAAGRDTALDVRGAAVTDKDAARAAYECQRAARRKHERRVARCQALEEEIERLERSIPALERRLEAAWQPGATESPDKLLADLRKSQDTLALRVQEWEDVAKALEAATDPDGD